MKPSSEYLSFTFLLVLLNRPASAAWSSELPANIKALKGSCAVIPCTFTFPGSRDTWGDQFSVAWYQYHSYGYPEIYNSKTPHAVLTAYKGRTEVLGDLESGNCTLSINPVRMEDAMKYYVWINPGSVKHLFYDVTVRLEVTDVPDQPELTDPGLVTEGSPIQLTCSVLHTCPLSPPVLTWNLGEAQNVTIQERLAGGPWRTKSSITYIPSHKDQGRDLQCTATFPNMQQSHRRTKLKIQYSPQNTVVSVVGNRRPNEGGGATLQYKPMVQPQSNCTVSRTRQFVTCYCVAEGNPAPSIEWQILNRTIPGDFNSSELQAALTSSEQTVIGLLRMFRSTFSNVSCRATNRHGTVLTFLPILQAAGGAVVLLLGLAGVIASLLTFCLLGVVINRVTRSRKKRGSEKEAEEEENPRNYRNGRDPKISQNAQRPPRDEKEELPNMYTKPNTRGSQDADNELNTTKVYEIMEMVEDYENVSPGEAPDHRGNPGNWDFTSGSDPVYSNV